ncbi:MAG: ABC transporter permease subunit, partial [Actinomycetota bacterium]|nr:ABC transporter permease subunit [Actinomycetota bacterium]
MLNWNQLQQLLDGTLVTIQVFVLAALLGTVLSLVFGVMGLSKNPIHRWVSRVYVEVARGVSAIVLLFWVAFALPIFLGFRLFSPLVAGVLALGISMGGYGAEV